MTDEPRYLDILNEDGSWIERPDLYLLARMAVSDREEDGMVDQIYRTMLNSDHATETFNTFEQDIQKRWISGGGKLTERLHAGHVVIEAVRIAHATGAPPTAAKAHGIVAYNHHRKLNKGCTESLENRVKDGFSKYRSTAHLQAALVLKAPSLVEIEKSEKAFISFLAMARAFEVFIDNNLAGANRFKWNPWRVPPAIEPNFVIQFEPLDDFERKAAGIV